ncbi:MAG: glycosyltransferase [Bradymonadales bacterium]
MHNRTLLIYHFFPRYREEFIKLAAARGWHFAADTVSTDEAMEGVDPQIFAGRFYPVRNVWIRSFLWQRSLLKLVSEQSWDAIVLVGSPLYLTNYIVTAYARARGIKVFFWTHGIRPGAKLWKRIVSSVALSGAHGLFVYGKLARTQLSFPWLPIRKIHVVYNSLNSVERETNPVVSKDLGSRKSLEVSGFFGITASVMIFVGRLVERKRLDLALRALHRARSLGTPLGLLIVGEGPAEGSLKQLVSELNLSDAVMFFGATYDESTLTSLFQASSFAVFPHAAGLGVIHAMRQGLPVLTDNDLSAHGPEVEFVIDGVSGIVCQSNSLVALSDGMVSMYRGRGSFDNTTVSARVSKIFTPEFQMSVMERAIEGATS